MNSKYIEDVLRTESDPIAVFERLRKNDIRLIHAALGLSSELAELIDAAAELDRVNTLEELGDMYWYLALIHEVLRTTTRLSEDDKAPLTATEDVEFNNEHELYIIGNIVDVIKKITMYGGTDEVQNTRFKQLLSLTLKFKHRLNKLCVFLGGSPSKVMETNIKKLKARYPEKFTSEKAEKRDLDTERKILEESNG